MAEFNVMRAGRQEGHPAHITHPYDIQDWYDTAPVEIQFYFSGFWPWPKEDKKYSHFCRLYMTLKAEGSVVDGLLNLPTGEKLDVKTAMKWAKECKGGLSVKENYSTLHPSSAIRDNGRIGS